MSETKHSPEPWRLSPAGKWYGPSVEAGPEGDGSRFVLNEGCAFDVGDLRRIVACVNACAGIPTEALESGALGKALDAASLAALSGWDSVDGRRSVERQVLSDLFDALRSLGRLT